MKKRFYLTLLILAIGVIALAGVSVRLLKAVVGQPRRLAAALAELGP